MTFWKRNLMSLRGQRNVTRNIPIEIFPNKFEDVEDLLYITLEYLISF